MSPAPSTSSRNRSRPIAECVRAEAGRAGRQRGVDLGEPEVAQREQAHELRRPPGGRRRVASPRTRAARSRRGSSSGSVRRRCHRGRRDATGSGPSRSRRREGVAGAPERVRGAGGLIRASYPGRRCLPSYTRPRRRSRRRRSQGRHHDRWIPDFRSPLTVDLDIVGARYRADLSRVILDRPDGRIQSPIFARRADPAAGRRQTFRQASSCRPSILPRSARLGARSRVAGLAPGRLASGSRGGRRRPDRSRGTSACEPSLHDLLRRGLPWVRGPDGWPHGVQEDDDVRWNWKTARSAQPGPGAQRLTSTAARSAQANGRDLPRRQAAIEGSTRPRRAGPHLRDRAGPRRRASRKITADDRLGRPSRARRPRAARATRRAGGER